MPAGRPKKSDAVLEVELRITPPDQKQITEWYSDTDDIEKLLCCKEGGEGTDKQLHYHCYLKTSRTRTWMTEWIYRVARCKDTGERGNAVFFSRKLHENSIGYIVKQGDVAHRKGIDDRYINEYIAKSEEYCRAKETKRKREQRTRKAQVDEILELVKNHLKETPGDRYVEGIAQMLLSEFHLRNLLLPSRSTLETIILTLLFPYNPDHVRSIYTRNLVPI